MLLLNVAQKWRYANLRSNKLWCDWRWKKKALWNSPPFSSNYFAIISNYKNKSIVTDVLSSLRLYISAAFLSPHSKAAQYSGPHLSILASAPFYILYCLIILVSHFSFILRELVTLPIYILHIGAIIGTIWNFGVLEIDHCPGKDLFA